MRTWPRVLIAVATCQRLRARADAQRATWVALASELCDVRFFLGGRAKERPGEVLVAAPDDYVSLPYKVREVFRWALERGYDYVLKVDDDVYVQPIRLLASDFQHDYVGRLSLGESDVRYASGFAHWVSRRSMEHLAVADVDDWAEDRWTGRVLHAAGIHCHEDLRYVIINSLNPENLIQGTEGPLPWNEVIACCELEPEMMRTVHYGWLASTNQLQERT